MIGGDCEAGWLIVRRATKCPTMTPSRPGGDGRFERRQVDASNSSVVAAETGTEVWLFSGALPCPGKCLTTVTTPPRRSLGDGRHETETVPGSLPSFG